MMIFKESELKSDPETMLLKIIRMSEKFFLNLPGLGLSVYNERKSSAQSSLNTVREKFFKFMDVKEE